MDINAARELLRKRAQEQKSGNVVIAPNPAKKTLKWGSFSEEVKIEGGRVATVPSGGFSFQEKGDDGVWKKIQVKQKQFALVLIDHSIVQVNNSEFANGRVTKSFWSNEVRQGDSFTNPFILRIKEGKDGKSETILADRDMIRDLGGKIMRIVYGVSPSGEIYKIMMPSYMYSLGNEKYKTSGYTILDADARSRDQGLGGISECLLTHDGFVELKNGSNTYTAPKFEFVEKINDEMAVNAINAATIIDDWYNEYHASNLAYIDKKMSGGSPDLTHNQGASRHGSENQAAAAPADNWETEGEDSDFIPF